MKFISFFFLLVILVFSFVTYVNAFTGQLLFSQTGNTTTQSLSSGPAIWSLDSFPIDLKNRTITEIVLENYIAHNGSVFDITFYGGAMATTTVFQKSTDDSFFTPVNTWTYFTYDITDVTLPASMTGVKMRVNVHSNGNDTDYRTGYIRGASKNNFNIYLYEMLSTGGGGNSTTTVIIPVPLTQSNDMPQITSINCPDATCTLNYATSTTTYLTPTTIGILFLFFFLSAFAGLMITRKLL